MKKHIILHGHFYQPPREDPWTGLIDYQESAAPYANWNLRITAECYAAGASSRVLDDNGEIISIRNNYTNMSFNFGPTLLSWLEKEDPHTYQRILEADKISLKRLGHGNAVAQSYNHTILPLDSPEDALTQIRWGLFDFEHRFRRRPEGMWLPECGVNEDVIDLLLGENIKFIILSPWQAHSIMNPGGEWESLKDKPAPSDRAFYIQRPGGNMAVFFYNPELASGISFGHLLRSREGFESAIRNSLEKSEFPMVSIATDGEIYGHHEPFGDMCLSSLIDHLGDNPDLEFTNYAAYLEAQPATQEVRLRPGDDELGTSWSCVHGVGRWFRDCGCSTGGEEGWNQSWRTPLRRAFDRLRRKTEPLWTKEIERLTGKTAREVLDSYAAVLCNAETPRHFAENAVENINEESRSKLLRLLEGAKFLQFMYTSCGWFFSDLSGIEPMQNMRYAYRAAELIAPDNPAELVEVLRSTLSEARSNIKRIGNGAQILSDSIIPKIPAEAKTAAVFFFYSLYKLHGKEKTSYGIWKGLEIQKEEHPEEGGGRLISGNISFRNNSTMENHKYNYKAVIDSHGFCPEVEILISGDWLIIPISSMSVSLRMEIQKTRLNGSENSLKKCMGAKVSRRILDLKTVEALNVPFGASGWQSLELSLHYGILLVLDQLKSRPAEEWPKLLETLDEILNYRDAQMMNADNLSVENISGKIVSRITEKLLKKSNAARLEQLVIFLEILHRHGLNPLKTSIQNTVYALLEKRVYCQDDCPSKEELRDLAKLVNINPVRFL